MQVRHVLAGFAAWAPGHQGVACPTTADLVADPIDPWGHRIEVTCADQPADQIVGVRSAGPDGVLGSDDDVVWWTLGRDATTAVRGPRWRARSR